MYVVFPVCTHSSHSLFIEMSCNHNEGSFTLLVRTGDRPSEGTDATVYAILHGEGLQSPQYKLDHTLKNDFKRGHESKFKITGTEVGTHSTLSSTEVFKCSLSTTTTFWDTLYVFVEERVLLKRSKIKNNMSKEGPR